MTQGVEPTQTSSVPRKSGSKKLTWLLVGCLAVFALIGIVVLGACGFTMWWAYSSADVDNSPSVLAQTDDFYTLVYLDAADEGVAELIDHAISEFQSAGPTPFPMPFQPSRGQAQGMPLPIRLEASARNTRGGPEWLIAASFSKSFRMYRTMFHQLIIGPTGADERTFEGATIYTVDTPEGRSVSISFEGNRLLIGSNGGKVADMSSGYDEHVESSKKAFGSLVEAVEMEGRDAWLYAMDPLMHFSEDSRSAYESVRPGIFEDLADVSIAAAGFDVASSDQVNWKLAVLLREPPADAQGLQDAIDVMVQQMCTASEMDCRATGELEWVTPTLAVRTGEVVGLERWISDGMDKLNDMSRGVRVE